MVGFSLRNDDWFLSMVPKPMFLEAGTGWAASVYFHPAWSRRWKLRESPKKEKLVFP